MRKLIVCVSAMAVMIFSSMAMASVAPQEDGAAPVQGSVVTEDKATEGKGAVVTGEKVTEEKATEGKGVETPVAGGWNTAGMTEIPQDVLAVYSKAVSGIDGAEFKPVAYLGSQVVAGKNHCLLCQIKEASTGDNPAYALVYINEDLQGNGKITNVVKFDIGELSGK